MKVRISWNYTSDHRYESDLDEKMRTLINDLCEAVPAQHLGSSGGTSFLGEMLPSDCSHTFEVPNMECALRLTEFMDNLLKFYDPEYKARLTAYYEGDPDPRGETIEIDF